MKIVSLVSVTVIGALLALHSDAASDPVNPYKDAEMRAVAKKFRAKRADGLLNVVPNGKSKPLTLIFKTLGIDQKRLGNPEHQRLDFVDYHIWQVSPSYELSIMVAINGSRDQGYGVRLRKRSK